MSDDKQPHFGIVTSGKTLKKLKLRLPKLPNLRNNKQLRTNLIVLVLILAGLTGLASWSHQQALRTAKLDAMSKVVNGLNPSQQALYYGDQGEYKIAQNLLMGELAKAKDTGSKVIVYSRLSTLAIKFQKYNDAKKYVDQAELLAPKSTAPYIAKSQLSEAQGDIASAKKYLQQAIDLLDKTSAGYNFELRDLKNSLDSLK